MDMKITFEPADIAEFGNTIVARLRSESAIAHLSDLVNMENKIMATLKEVQDALAKVAADAIAEKAEVAEAIQSFKDTIQSLRDQITTGTAATPADLDAILAAINGISARVQDITIPESTGGVV